MAELRLHGREVHTVFDLLGAKEDDITYSLGWGLAQSDQLAKALLGEVLDGEPGALTAILLQQGEAGTGRTDIEIQTQRMRLVIEAKRGWDLPGTAQLAQYAARLNAEGGDRDKAIAVIAECASYYPPVVGLARELAGVPIRYVPWQRVASLVSSSAASSPNHAEKRLLTELHRYLRRLMTSRDVTSNMVYVVSLNHDAHDWSDLTFVQTVMERDRYYHPVGDHWPKTPANYLGFRFDGQLQRISFVENYEVMTHPHDYIPEIKEWADWSHQPHFIYTLGPALPLPEREIRTGPGMRNRRTEIALDLLLTCSTVREAELATADRLAKAGED
jgi:hypothetical protein